MSTQMKKSTLTATISSANGLTDGDRACIMAALNKVVEDLGYEIKSIALIEQKKSK